VPKEPFADLNLLGRGRHLLEIGGRLPLNWTSSLAAGLASHGIGIVEGRALRTHLDWAGSFVLDTSGATTDPGSLDMLTLARADTRAAGDTEIHLTRFTCRRLEHGLEVRVFGPDQQGFLARLFGRFALLTLFPSRFEISTTDDGIDDTFVVTGIGGVVPSAAAAAACERMLRDCVR